MRRWPAPAKINLALHVTGKRPDGYHEIETFAVFTRFGDLVSVTEAEVDSFDVDGPFAAGVPVDSSNLVIKAREALRASLPSRLWGGSDGEAGRGGGQKPTHEPATSDSLTLPSPRSAVRIDPPRKGEGKAAVAIRLTKNLPIASGVGGGSSDAAATLTALNEIWATNFAFGQLAQLGKTIGADVPMCLAARPLLASGIGEQIEPVAGVPALALVLVNPGVAVSTADVFRSLTHHDNPGLPPLPRAIEFHSLRNWLETTRNDLESAARTLQPVIGSALTALDKAGSGFSRMSGSGATCFGLFETGNVAKRAAVEIRRRHPDWFVAATRSIASEAA
ncbi:MAG: 4-(cytidine 5'-diphospho)-2-C-methyl-D-erythritol kinase [Rhizobiaceae bacterium]